MSMPDIFEHIDYRSGCNLPKTRGSLVQLGTNYGPVYEIVHVEGNTAWIREPVTFRNECLAPVDRLRIVTEGNRKLYD